MHFLNYAYLWKNLSNFCLSMLYHNWHWQKRKILELKLEQPSIIKHFIKSELVDWKKKLSLASFFFISTILVFKNKITSSTKYVMTAAKQTWYQFFSKHTTFMFTENSWLYKYTNAMNSSSMYILNLFGFQSKHFGCLQQWQNE